MKIIHCSDLHLDSKMDSVLGQDIAKVRRSELLLAMRRMFDEARAQKISAVILAGDIFDTERITKSTLTYVLETFEKFSEIKICLLPGNHGGDRVFSKSLELPKNVFLFDEQLKSVTLSDRVTVSGIVLTPESAGNFYNSLNFDADTYNILVLHGQDAKYDSDKTIVVNLPALADKNIDYLALGHIHKFKSGALDRRGSYCYCGALSGRGFDECGQKGYVLIDTDQNSFDFVPLSQREFCEVPIDITGLLTLNELEERISDGVKDIEEANLVKVTLTGSYTADTHKDITTLQKFLEQKFYFAKLCDKSKLSINIEDYKNNISLKGEFIRLVLDDKTYTEEQKSDIIYCGIKALYGEDLD